MNEFQKNELIDFIEKEIEKNTIIAGQYQCSYVLEQSIIDLELSKYYTQVCNLSRDYLKKVKNVKIL